MKAIFFISQKRTEICKISFIYNFQNFQKVVRKFLIEVKSNKISKKSKNKKTWLGEVGTCQFHCFATNSQRIDSLFTSYFDMFYVRLTETQKYLDVFCSLFYPGNTLTVSLDMSVFLRTARKLGNCILKKVSEDNWK